jgi:hypothetical protein
MAGAAHGGERVALLAVIRKTSRQVRMNGSPSWITL